MRMGRRAGGATRSASVLPGWPAYSSAWWSCGSSATMLRRPNRLITSSALDGPGWRTAHPRCDATLRAAQQARVQVRTRVVLIVYLAAERRRWPVAAGEPRALPPDGRSTEDAVTAGA